MSPSQRAALLNASFCNLPTFLSLSNHQPDKKLKSLFLLLPPSPTPPRLLHPALYEFRVPESMEPGTALGVIRATDADIGENAAMDYRIIGSEGPGMFDIVTNRSTQEGVIMLRKVGGGFF